MSDDERADDKMSDDNMSDTSLADSLENSPVRAKRTFEDLMTNDDNFEDDIITKEIETVEIQQEIHEELHEELHMNNGLTKENECEDMENGDGDDGSNSSKSSDPKEPVTKIQKKNESPPKKGRLPILINRKIPGEGLRNNFISRENLFQCSGDNETPKENKTSRVRREMAHNTHLRKHGKITTCNTPATHFADPDDDEYLTPFQRKEKQIRLLNGEIKKLQGTINDGKNALEAAKLEKEEAIEKAVKEKTEEMEVVVSELTSVKQSFEELTLSHQEALKSIDALEQTIRELNVEIERRENESQETYLRMFQKGRDSAVFERQEEVLHNLHAYCSQPSERKRNAFPFVNSWFRLQTLEQKGKEDPGMVTVTELLDKLQTTESRLEWWQNLRRQETYKEGETAETESEVKMRFMRDALFHYLSDKSNHLEHLRAMCGVVDFTQVQRRKINKAFDTKFFEKGIDKKIFDFSKQSEAKQ